MSGVILPIHHRARPMPDSQAMDPDRIMERLQRAYNMKVEPAVAVVMEQMFRAEPHIDLVALELRYPEPEDRNRAEGRLDVRA